MAKVLVVYHSLGGATKQMAEAVAEGAKAAGAKVVVKTGLEATVDDLLECDALALGSPDYFSYIAGGLKDFLDRTYYHSQGKVVGKPTGLFASAGGPPDRVLGVLRQAVSWFKLALVADPVGTSGGVSEAALADCRTLGATLAAAGGK